MRVLIIDSGINIEHPYFQDTSFIHMVSEKWIDDNGHGTAIAGIIAKHHVDLYIYKLFSQMSECDLTQLIKVLNSINPKQYDIINMSFGITSFADLKQKKQLEDVCNRLSEEGTILVSAFNNEGYISYPAAFSSVIGVDTAPLIFNKNEYEYVEESVVTARAYGRIQKVAWTDPKYTIVNGNSFACAHMTGIVIELIRQYGKENLKEVLKKHAVKCHNETQMEPLCECEKKWADVRAIVLPFNKEIRTLLAHEDMCSITIVDIFDFRINCNIGANAADKVGYGKTNEHIIKDFYTIDWGSDQFNTVIAGHLYELSRYEKHDLLQMVIDKCRKYHKHLVCFDTPGCQSNKVDYRVTFPRCSKSMVPRNRFGKLHKIVCPVLAVVGTGSNQGKFSLQLSLYKQLIEAGFSVGRIGTEPSAICLGYDFCIANGYQSELDFSDEEMITLTNEMVHQIDDKEVDLCLVGTQANTVSYFGGNLSYLPIKQHPFLLGTNPDAFILVINPFDDISYIQRTIQYMEGSINAACIAIVIYHKTRKNRVGTLVSTIDISESGDFYTKIDTIKKKINLPVLSMKEAVQSSELVDIIVRSFT